MKYRTSACIVVLFTLVAVVAAGCGGGSDNSSSSNGTATDTGGGSGGGATDTGGGSGGGETLQLAADPSGALKFDPTSLEATAGQVTIDFTNDSSLPHNVTIEGNGIEEVASDTVTGANSSVSADLPAGTYTFYCSVDGHKAAGMEGTLTVK
jgi:plastocyanin